jgi:hypothetical protein
MVNTSWTDLMKNEGSIKEIQRVKEHTAYGKMKKG